MKHKNKLLIAFVSTYVALAPHIAFAQRVVETEEEDTGFLETATKFVAFIFSQIPRWVGAVIILTFFIGLSRLAKKAVENKMIAKIAPEHQELTIVTGRMASVVVMVIGIAAALGVIGVNLMNLIAAVGLGISLGMQDFFSNFMAGIMILVSRPFVIGDFIKVGDQLGKVEEIQSRVTILKSLDGVKIVIPNGLLFKDKLSNFTGFSQRRFSINVGVEYRTDLAKAVKVCMEVMQQTDGVLKNPAPNVLIQEFGDSAILLELRLWVQTGTDFWTILSNVRQKLKAAFDAVGITIPFPLRTLVLDRDSEAAVLPTMQVSGEAYAKKLSERMAADQKADEATKRLVEQHEKVDMAEQAQNLFQARMIPETAIAGEEPPMRPDEDRPGSDFLKNQ